MSRIAYVNGRYLPHGHAMVHVEDRGFQFADGVYEVCEVWSGEIVDMTRHLDRLRRFGWRSSPWPGPVRRSALGGDHARGGRPQPASPTASSTSR